MSERENVLIKSTAMSIALALSFGGCAGYEIGFAQGQGSVAPMDVRPIRFEIPRRIYKSDEAYRDAVMQAHEIRDLGR